MSCLQQRVPPSPPLFPQAEQGGYRSRRAAVDGSIRNFGKPAFQWGRRSEVLADRALPVPPKAGLEMQLACDIVFGEGIGDTVQRELNFPEVIS